MYIEDVMKYLAVFGIIITAVAISYSGIMSNYAIPYNDSLSSLNSSISNIEDVTGNIEDRIATAERDPVSQFFLAGNLLLDVAALLLSSLDFIYEFISSVGNILGVPSYIISGIIVFIAIGIVFAIYRFFTGRDKV